MMNVRRTDKTASAGPQKRGKYVESLTTSL